MAVAPAERRGRGLGPAVAPFEHVQVECHVQRGSVGAGFANVRTEKGLGASRRDLEGQVVQNLGPGQGARAGLEEDKRDASSAQSARSVGVCARVSAAPRRLRDGPPTACALRRLSCGRPGNVPRARK